MFKLHDNFVSCDTNRQPYSFTAERHTPIDNMHAWVKDDVFNMASIGNRYVMNSPILKNAEFKMNFKATYMAEFGCKFMVYFGYDERTRTGKGIRFYYDLKGNYTISLVEVIKTEINVISEKTVASEPMREDVFYPFELKVTDGMVSGRVLDIDFDFDTNVVGGKLAVERADFIGELIIDSVLLTSEDSFDFESIIEETKVDIPCYNGGDIPYSVSWKVDKIDGEYYLTAKLDGGTKTRKVNREDRPGQYVAEKDWMTAPYIGIGNKENKALTYSIANGEKCFIDPNIYWECQKGFFGDTELPIVNTYRIPEYILTDDAEIVFGYEDLVCSGYQTQQGGCEFRFTKDGILTYMGDTADGRDIYELYSQEVKYAHSLIPDDCYERDAVMEHLKYNHYFDVDEDIEFEFVMKTMMDTDYLTVKANVIDVYESEVIDSFEPECLCDKWDYGYNLISAKIKIPAMKLGLWKIEFKVMYGSKEYKRYVKVFEVYDKDSDVNPALAVGLPFTFHMPNEQKWLMRSAFDMWNPMRSCDKEHYFNCVTDTPIEASVRKPWKVNKPLKREWFVWIGSRTTRDWSVETNRELIENCDYAWTSIDEKVMDLSQSCLYPLRKDNYHYDNFLMRGDYRRGLIADFLKLHPDLAEKIIYKPEMEEFTFEHFTDFMRVCGSEWIKYENQIGIERIRECNNELKAINPKIRRSIYGPINSYVTPTLTYHSLDAYFDKDADRLSKDMFTGFCIFEDYPYSCSYQTYRGAFMLSSILVNSPELVVYPEQYSGGRGGCIDGAVKFAHAPMGAYDLDAYQNATHAYEFVYNTAYKLKDGYHYWNTYGFHRNPSLVSDLTLYWKKVIDNKPAKPCRSIAFLAEYSETEDAFDVYTGADGFRSGHLTNQSDSGHGLVFECSREAGVPNGFNFKFDALSTLTADECDVLVLPSLAHADKKYIAEIKRLYNEGVNLIAVSDVTGLEEIFGVSECRREANVNCVCYSGETEFIRDNNATLAYKSNGAKVIMSSEMGDELIMATERTAIINTCVLNLGGAYSQYMAHAKTLHIVGTLVRKALCDIIKKLSSPLALGENVGTTLFETEDGRKMLLAIDYTPFDNAEHDIKEAVVRLNMDNITDVKCEREVFVGKKDGRVSEIRFDIKPHESVFIELI